MSNVDFDYRTMNAFEDAVLRALFFGMPVGCTVDDARDIFNEASDRFSIAVSDCLEEAYDEESDEENDEVDEESDEENDGEEYYGYNAVALSDSLLEPVERVYAGLQNREEAEVFLEFLVEAENALSDLISTVSAEIDEHVYLDSEDSDEDDIPQEEDYDEDELEDCVDALQEKAIQRDFLELPKSAQVRLIKTWLEKVREENNGL